MIIFSLISTIVIKIQNLISTLNLISVYSVHEVGLKDLSLVSSVKQKVKCISFQKILNIIFKLLPFKSKWLIRTLFESFLN